MAGMFKGKTGFRGDRSGDATTENIELLTGQRGNGLDQAVTFRSLSELGFINLKRMQSGSFKPEMSDNIGSGSGDVLPVDTPVQPQNVQATGGWHVILVEWSRASYQGHSHAEVWRADTDNLAVATLVGTTAANVYSDAIGKGMKAWYWVRFVNRNNVRGPYNSDKGTYAETAVDVQDVLDAIQGKIEYSHLAKWLASDIERQTDVSSKISEAVTEIEKEMRESGTLILNEYRSAISAIDGTLQRLEAMRIEFDNGVAALYKEQIARVTQDQALARQTESLRVDFDGDMSEAAAQVNELSEAFADEKQAVAKRFTEVIADYDFKLGEVSYSISSAVERLDEAISDESGARAKAIETVEASINGVGAAVQETKEAVAKINADGSLTYQAMWGAKAQVGDIKAGIGILVDGSGTSQVMVSASQFFVFDPNSSTPTAPLFAIDNGQVVIAKAMIQKATIQIIQAEQITADYLKAGVSISSPFINGGRIEIGSNFTVDENGNATMWSATARYMNSYYGTYRYAQITEATLKNCVIEEDCTVKGTIYADKIVGGVITERDFTSVDVQSGFSTDWQTALTLNIIRSSLQMRRLRIIGTGYSVYAYAPANNSMSYTAYWRIQYRGLTMAEGSITAGVNGGPGGDSASKTHSFNELIAIAAQTTGAVTLQFRFPVTNAGSGGSSGKYTGGQVTARLFIDSEEMSAA